MTKNKYRKLVLVISLVGLTAMLSSLGFAYHVNRLNSRFALCSAVGVLVLAAIWFDWGMLHKQIGLSEILRYGDNKITLITIILALVIVVSSTGMALTKFQGKDDYALEIKEFIGFDSGGLEYLPYFWNEEYLSLMIRKDAVAQLECFIRDPEIVLYEYPVSENTTYWKLSGLCVMLNEIMQGLNAEDKDSFGAMQKVFAAIDDIEFANYEPDFNPVIVVLFEVVMVWMVIVLMAGLLQWFRVNNYLKANGGLETVLLRIQEEDDSDEGEEVYYDERNEE